MLVYQFFNMTSYLLLLYESSAFWALYSTNAKLGDVLRAYPRYEELHKRKEPGEVVQGRSSVSLLSSTHH